MAFQPLIVAKGDKQRVVQSQAELVQAEYEGFTVKKEAGKRLTAALTGEKPAPKKTESNTDS